MMLLSDGGCCLFVFATETHYISIDFYMAVLQILWVMSQPTPHLHFLQLAAGTRMLTLLLALSYAFNRSPTYGDDEAFPSSCLNAKLLLQTYDQGQ